jgi:cyclase
MKDKEQNMNKAAVLCAVFLVTIFSGIVFAQDGLTKIADNVYSYENVKNAGPANSFAANAGIIVGSDGIVVVDTLISTKEAQRFIKDIRKISDKPIRYVIDTHSHLDHTFGNAEFVKLGAVIVSHANGRENMLENSEVTLKNAAQHGLTPAQMEGTKIAYPILTFTDRMSINFDDQRVELIYIGPSHTTGSIIINLPDKKVLFAGDILFTDFHPYLGDSDISGWLKNLDFIESLNVEKIIPGHGPVSGKKDVADMRSYLVAFDVKARELVRQNKDITIIAAELQKTLPVKSQAEWMIPYNLQMKYLKGK